MKQSSLFYVFGSALFYLCFSIGAVYNEIMLAVYSGLMLFLPGVTFPLFATDFYLISSQPDRMMKFFHFLLSIVIYHGAVWLYSGFLHYYLLPVIAGSLGSLFYFLSTLLLLKVSLSLRSIIVTTLLSGIVFTIPMFHSGDWISLGVALFLWTVINGFVHYKHHATLGK